MGFILVDAGEEYLMKNGFDGATIDTGLYNDNTDSISETDIDPSTAISTEPTGSNYSRISNTPTAADYSGDWGIEYAGSYTTDDSTQTVDGAFGVINFQSDDASQGSANDNLVYTAGLSQSRDLSQIDTLDLTVTVTVT
jgi:hypothetical protein